MIVTAAIIINITTITIIIIILLIIIIVIVIIIIIIIIIIIQGARGPSPALRSAAASSAKWSTANLRTKILDSILLLRDSILRLQHCFLIKK